MDHRGGLGAPTTRPAQATARRTSPLDRVEFFCLREDWWCTTPVTDELKLGLIISLLCVLIHAIHL